MPNDTPITFAEWQARYADLRTRAERLNRAITDRARKTAREAGLDPSIAFLHAHNAMCSKDSHPWTGVNYRLVRKVLYLERLSWEPNRIVSRVSDRLWRRVQFPR